MAFDPTPFNGMPLSLLIKLQPQANILDGLLIGILPAIALPSLYPDGNALLEFLPPVEMTKARELQQQLSGRRSKRSAPKVERYYCLVAHFVFSSV